MTIIQALAIAGIALLLYGYISQFRRANRLEKRLYNLYRTARFSLDPKAVAKLFPNKGE